ncbi:MAG: porin [Azoarcus sp.]|nr:porin [Azoarcus sp.]
MQKKLIALAIAGLVSAPAFAQSEVTIYGTLDYGYTFQNQHIDSNTRSRQGVDSGVSKANRLGFKGVEDLGNGLKAVFVYEAGLQGDGGSWKEGEARQSYAALAGGFGTVAFGRHYTPQHLFTSAIDPFGKNGLGNAGNVLAQDKRLSNLLAYISPNWGGFSFIAGYTGSYAGNEPNENRTGTPALENVRVLAFAPSFTSGGLFLGLNYHQAKFNNEDPFLGLVEHLRVYEGYAAYDFGPVKIGGLLGRRITSLEGADDVKVTQWLVGATWKITSADALLFSYAHRKAEALNLDDTKLGQWAVGYQHALSKRTALYAQYAYQNQNSAQKAAGAGPLGLGSVLGYGAADLTSDGNFGSGTGYRQGVAVGFRHDF